MTIGDRLRKYQPDVWIRLLVEYDLVHKYIASEQVNVIHSLMKPGSYSGKVERKNRAYTQPHRLVIK